MVLRPLDVERVSDRPSIRVSECPSVRVSECPTDRMSECPNVRPDRVTECPSVRPTDQTPHVERFHPFFASRRRRGGRARGRGDAETSMSRALDVDALSRVMANATVVSTSTTRGGMGSGTALRRDENDERAREDAEGKSRIEAALEGTSDWHLRVNRVERGSLRATYEVKYARVPVRAQPHIDSAIVCVKKRGDLVVGTSVLGGAWLELLGLDADGENVDGGAGWMLVNHPELGALLEHVHGVELPSTIMRLASAGSVGSCDHRNLPRAHEQRTYRVIFSPAVPVRDAPATCARVVAFKVVDAVVQACARRGDWIELALDDGEAKRGEEANVDEKRGEEASVNVHAKMWMLTFHPDHGKLLRRVNADGSDALND